MECDRHEGEEVDLGDERKEIKKIQTGKEEGWNGVSLDRV